MGTYIVAVCVNALGNETDVWNNTYSLVATLTMLGDVNGDHTVNSLDIGALNAYWAPATGTPPWSQGYHPNVDCNDDGYINSLDIGIVNAHWGQSW